MDDLRSLTPAELPSGCAPPAQPAYRAEQVFRWLHGRGTEAVVESVEAISNVPRELGDALAADAPCAR